MGLFCVPNKAEADMTAMDFVEIAEANIRLWKENQRCDYLFGFACHYLEKAAALVKPPKERDGCKMCLGAKGGVPGNENVVGGVVVCDYCSAQLMDMKAAGWFGKGAPNES